MDRPDIYFRKRQDCPACKSNKKDTILSMPYDHKELKHYINSSYADFGIDYSCFSGHYYKLDRCAECGIIYQKEIPTDSLMTKIYDEWLDVDILMAGELKAFGIQKYASYARRIINAIYFIDRKPSELSVLDFGMGLGTWCRIANAFGCRTYGHDISENRMQHVKRLGIRVLTYEEISEHRFDFINVDQVIEHVAHPFEILSYLSEVLHKNGLIYLAVPNGQDIEKKLDYWQLGKNRSGDNPPNPFVDRIDNSLNPVSPFEHINCFDHDSLVRIASSAGLTLANIPNRFVGTPQPISLFQLLRNKIGEFRGKYSLQLPTERKRIGQNNTELFFKNLD